MRRESCESTAVLWALQPAASITTRQQKTIRERDKQKPPFLNVRLSHSASITRTSPPTLKQVLRLLHWNIPRIACSALALSYTCSPNDNRVRNARLNTLSPE